MAERRLLLFPGLGADQRLFQEQSCVLGNQLGLPDWIAPQGQETLQEYSRRLAEKLVQSELKDSEEVVLGGMSFGGMVALEIADSLARFHQKKVPKVLLIASGRTRRLITPFFRFQAAFAKGLPDSLLRGLLRNQVVSRFVQQDKLSLEHGKLLADMVDDMNFEFFRWALGACADWDPQDRFLGQNLPFEIFELQGEHDPVIPRSLEGQVAVIPNGSHLIQYTHAQEVNGWLQKHLQGG